MPRTTRRNPTALNERRFHRWLARELPAGRSGLLRLGDDAYALPFGTSQVLLLTSDAFSEGTHFLAGSPPLEIGRAIAAANLSDLAAKGGRPIAFLLDVLLPPRSPSRWPKEVVRGAEQLCAEYGCHLVGGDTKPARSRSVIGTAVGLASRKALAPRTGARPGDLLAVTGFVGGGGAASLALRKRGVPGRRELKELLAIRPRIPEGIRLARSAHAMIDTSDGVAEAAHLLAEASRVRVTVAAELLPLAPSLKRRVSQPKKRLELAFFGGDYELLCSIAPREFPQVRRLLRRLGCPLNVIGHVDRGQGAWLRVDGRVVALPHSGWQPFERG